MADRFETGSTYQFKLLNGLGYAYFKFIDFRLHDPNMLLINVFDFITETSAYSADGSNLNELFFGAKCFLGRFPKNKKDFGIKYIGNMTHEFDNFVPDLAKKMSFEQIKKGFDPYKSKWCPVVCFDFMAECDFDDIRNLESYNLVSIADIQIRTTLEVCRKKNIDPREFFDVENPDIYPHYFNVISKTEYSKIPKYQRGIAKGYEKLNRRI